MRRIVLWFMTTVTVVVLLFGYHTSTTSQPASGGNAAVSAPAGAGSSGSTGAGTGSGTTGSGTTGTGTTSGSAETVTGPSVDTRWGPVQVRINVANGKITDVEVVDYPTGNSRDRSINAYAIPVLVQDTLDAQSANIDMVSGATVTSEGYLESLQAALDEAGL
jgi:uncharacterized protein with FMN-binding domain